MLEIHALDAFYGDAQALHGVTLDVGDAEIVGIVGPNGAGKSTLVRSIAGLHRAVRGQILLDDVELAALPAHRVSACGVAIVPEGRRVFAHMSVRENLLLGAYRRDVRAAHKQTLAVVHQLFPRLRERSAQLAGSLSGGEQQMLAIGRALMARPRLLLLDEPSLGLAPAIVDEVFEAVKAINEQRVSVLLVEQDIERALDSCARAYLLTEGRIAAEGTPDALRSSVHVRRGVLGL